MECLVLVSVHHLDCLAKAAHVVAIVNESYIIVLIIFCFVIVNGRSRGNSAKNFPDHEGLGEGGNRPTWL